MQNYSLEDGEVKTSDNMDGKDFRSQVVIASILSSLASVMF